MIFQFAKSQFTRGILCRSAPRQEVSDTELLLDLCDGIYLARVQGNLHAEWMLYHEACQAKEVAPDRVFSMLKWG